MMNLFFLSRFGRCRGWHPSGIRSELIIPSGPSSVIIIPSGPRSVWRTGGCWRKGEIIIPSGPRSVWRPRNCRRWSRHGDASIRILWLAHLADLASLGLLTKLSFASTDSFFDPISNLTNTSVNTRVSFVATRNSPPTYNANLNVTDSSIWLRVGQGNSTAYCCRNNYSQEKWIFDE